MLKGLMMQLLGKYNYIIMAILTFSLLTQTVRLEKRNAHIAELDARLVVASTNEYQCKESVKAQNMAIEKLRLDYNKADTNYKQLLSKPAEVRFKTIYKQLPNIGVKSDECKDIKNMLDDIRNAGY